jgi:hypothetical protein
MKRRSVEGLFQHPQAITLIDCYGWAVAETKTRLSTFGLAGSLLCTENGYLCGLLLGGFELRPSKPLSRCDFPAG